MEVARIQKLQRFDFGQKAGHPAGAKDRQMEGAVLPFPLIGIGCRVAGQLGGFGKRQVGRGHVWGRTAQRQGFKSDAHIHHFSGIGSAEGGDPHSATGFNGGQPARNQPQKGFAHRDMAGLEGPSDMVLRQFFTGLAIATHDFFGEGGGDPVRDRAGGGGCVFGHIL